MIFPSRELGKLFILDINANQATSNLSHTLIFNLLNDYGYELHKIKNTKIVIK